MKGNQIEINIRDIMQKRLTITGSTLRARDTTFKSSLAREVEKHVWPMIESGKFKPVIYQTFPMNAAAKAHIIMESSEHIGKIILVNDL